MFFSDFEYEKRDYMKKFEKVTTNVMRLGTRKKKQILITRYFLEKEEQGLNVAKYDNLVTGITTVQLEILFRQKKEILKQKSYRADRLLDIEQTIFTFLEYV
jgi:hypothetical protein